MTREEFLEKAVKRVMTAKKAEIRTVVFALVTNECAVETIYSSDNWSDKILVAGTVQTDAMYQSIAVNSEDEEKQDETD